VLRVKRRLAVDKLYYISNIKFKGFKSFKNAQAQFPQGFVALAGPNGSGKSNVADAIRFCFGEMGTKAIRVRRASELVNLNSTHGEVTIVIQHSKEQDKKFEINRTISADGKTGYKLNGKSMTRTNVLEALRPHGLEVGTHNIIAQGQVQQIVEMNPKDRRAIIDQAAGISEFDDKKKEALGELSKVEAKISEAKIVLAERGAYLLELEKEKNAALSYQDAKTLLERSRATLLGIEYTKLNNQFDELLKSKGELATQIGALDESLSKLSKSKEELEAKRKELADKMSQGGQKESLVSQIQEAKVQIAQHQTLITQKQESIKDFETQLATLAQKKMDFGRQLASTNAQLKQKEQYLITLKKELEQAKLNAGISEDDTTHSSGIDKLNEELSDVRANKASTIAKCEGIQALIEHKGSLAKETAAELEKLSSTKGSDELEKMSDEIKELNSQLTSLFDKEKKFNRDIPDLDRKLLEAKERVAALRGSASPVARNPALLTVHALKEAKMGGIYGLVSELISLDEEYQQAVEASAGGRLNYVVVDSLDTADTIIKKLKSEKSGRCSFIPLDKIIIGRSASEKLPPSALGRMIDFIKYSPELDNAMRYVFEDTLLVNDVSTAKKIGIGTWRMVTLGGELLERSGVISGGTNRSSLMARSSLQKAESDVDSIKSERDALYSDLYSVRDEMQKLRKERASAELKLRTKEAELGAGADRQARTQKLKESLLAHNQELEKQKSSLQELTSSIRELEKKEQSLLSSLCATKEMQAKQKEESKKKAGDSQKKYEDVLEKHSQFLTDIDSKKQESNLLQTQIDESAQEHSRVLASLEECKKQIKSSESGLKKSESELAKFEQALQEVSATVKKYYAKMQSLQSELDTLGAQEGKAKFERDALVRTQNEVNIKHATIETKLVDVKAEWEKYASVQAFDNISKSELEQNIKSSEAKMNELGMVNLKAPQLYDEKKAELEGIGQKVGTLQNEKEAVLSLIEEIETKKLRLFNETFSAVNTQFKKLFAMVFKGEGTLMLDDPSNPLDSGLGMRVRGIHDKRDKYLESMSGGEKTLLALMLIFSLQMKKSAPFYILDEAEAALDKVNASKMADFIRQMSKGSQFITITHNDAILSAADVVLGVARDENGSRIVGVQLSHGSQFVKKESPITESANPMS